MARILVISNGHGEDLSGSLLAKQLRDSGHIVDALPIVGLGNHYTKEDINIIGKTKEFQTAGLGYNSFKGRINDLFNGQIFYFFRKLFLTISVRDTYEFFLVVGDIVPIFFSWLARKEFIVYLVAYSSHYEGYLNLPWPCKFFLKSNKVRQIYSRDLLTAKDLTNQLKKEVFFYGNPFMEKLFIPKNHDNQFFEIALLPGSRLPELLNNMILMLDLLENISKNKYFRNIRFKFALVNDFNYEHVAQILDKREWELLNNKIEVGNITYKYKSISVDFCWNSFEKILCNSNMVISMAGTAAEQAIGLAKPVIQVIGGGPQFTKSFADAQRRLLGEFVFCALNYKTKQQQIDQTVSLILKVIYLIKLDSNFILSCKKNASIRLGEEGSHLKLSFDICSRILND